MDTGEDVKGLTTYDLFCCHWVIYSLTCVVVSK